MPSPVHPYSDYGVALRTLRSARSWLAFMLFLCVLAQFIGFAILRWSDQPYENMKAQRRPVSSAVTISKIVEYINSLTAAPRPAASAPAPGRPAPVAPFIPASDQLNIRNQWHIAFTMAVPVTQLAGLIAIFSQAIIIFVTLLVVLVAQAPGVAQITRSFIWSVLVLFMFLPWQYFAHDFPIPGVIYSYSELQTLLLPHLVGDKVYTFQVWLLYLRFLIWPIIGLLALLITAERYRAGVMIAIGHPLQSMLQPRPPGPMPSLIPPASRPMAPAKV